MSKYDIDENTPMSAVLQRLDDARAEGRIYVVANLVRVLRHRGCKGIALSQGERVSLLKALSSVRGGKKVLASWLPIGYQTARLLSLSRLLSGRKVRVTNRDATRIRRAVYFYRTHDNWHNKRQLQSLLLTAKNIGLSI